MFVLWLVAFALCVDVNVSTFFAKDIDIYFDDRDPRSFFFLPPIIPINSLKRRKSTSQRLPCVGDCGFNGICSSKSECGGLGGTSSGLCSDSTVCCIIYKRCGESTSADVSYFVDPNFPNTYQGGSQCTLRVVKSSPKICQVRVDFKEFSLMQPSNSGNCESDFFTVSSCLTNKICGKNKGQHSKLKTKMQEFTPNFPEGSDSVTLSIDTAATVKGARKWNLEIKQIPCDSTWLAPSGCLMYFTETSGSISSFNYDDSTSTDKRNRHIRGLNYGICVKSRDQYCHIEWTEDTNPHAFTMSGNASWITSNTDSKLDGLNGTSCNNNFVVIANPYVNGRPANVDRFCGLSFDAITTSTKPFVLFVVTGQNKTYNTLDEGNRGFKLNYRQLPCRN